MEGPNTLLEAITHYSDPANCHEFMMSVRWPDGVVRCPVCGSDKVTYMAKSRLFNCRTKHPKQKFSLKTGTIFEDSPISLEKWLPAVWLLVSAKNGISSYEVHRALGVTQKTAWFMMHRIRLAMQSGSFMKMGGGGTEIEVDETFIGGKARNMHKSKRDARITGRGGKDKTIVLGILERGGRVRAKVVDNRKAKTLQPIIREHVEAGTPLYTDFLLSYEGMASTHAHEVVDHAIEYVNGRVHTNGLEETSGAY